MEHKSFEIRLEDIVSVNIGQIETLLMEFCEKTDGAPASMVAAHSLLRRTKRYLVDLHEFIYDEIGEIIITVPDFHDFYFDKVFVDEPNFLGVRLIPKKTTEAAGEPEPQAVKKLAGEAPKKKEPVTDPKTIESYRSSIEQLLGALDPAARAKMLFEIATKEVEVQND